jgi:hypothetical protein
MLHLVMSTLVTMPYKKWDPFTEVWLCNPALGLADPERVPEQPEAALSTRGGAHNWPLFKSAFPVLGPGLKAPGANPGTRAGVNTGGPKKALVM